MSIRLPSDNIVEQRIKLTQINPNPLFEKWLLEWLEYAEQKQSMKKHALNKALTSLRKYPLLLTSGRDCAILDGFGTGICRMLDERLKKEENVITEQKQDESLREAINKARDRINQVGKKSTTSGIVSCLQREMQIENNEESSSDIELHSEERSEENANTVFMSRGSFTIILLVDTQETVGKTKRNLDATVQLLTEKKVNFEIRRLSVGDFLWICRDHNNREVVLPYIIERKRMDDLAGSIKDGRFHEQKFRLTDCGVQNVIYLVENKGNNQFLGLPIATLLQAATNTHVHNNFSVKFTDSHADSMFYLSVLTNVLNETFKDKNFMMTKKANLWHCNVVDEGTIPVMQFDEFAQTSTKMRNFTIRDLFVRQLVQLKTLSVEKALAITKIYPTPRDLLSRYACVDQKEGELLLAEIKCSTGKKIGPVISRVIYNLYNLSDPS